MSLKELVEKEGTMAKSTEKKSDLEKILKSILLWRKAASTNGETKLFEIMSIMARDIMELQLQEIEGG